MSGYGRIAPADSAGEWPHYRPSVGRAEPADADPFRGDEEDGRWSGDDPDLTGVTVLLVEDDQISREALEVIFAYHGAQVAAATTAAEALALYERGLPTVVVSDIGLPEEDGCALLRAIRTREFGRGRHTPAVAISAFPGRETSERARGAGFDAFLPKPIDVHALLRVVRDLSAPAP